MTTDLRQNKDLVESLNEVYLMVTAFSKELDILKTELENNKEESAEKVLQLNNTILDISANLNKRMRVYQVAQENVATGLNELANIKEEMERLKENNKIMQLRLTNFKNDMIALQSHIINAPDLTPDVELLKDFSAMNITNPMKEENKYARLLDPRTNI